MKARPPITRTQLTWRRVSLFEWQHDQGIRRGVIVKKGERQWRAEGRLLRKAGDDQALREVLEGAAEASLLPARDFAGRRAAQDWLCDQWLGIAPPRLHSNHTAITWRAE